MNTQIFSPHKRGKSPNPNVVRKQVKSKTTILQKMKKYINELIQKENNIKMQ